MRDETLDQWPKRSLVWEAILIGGASGGKGHRKDAFQILSHITGSQLFALTEGSHVSYAFSQKAHQIGSGCSHFTQFRLIPEIYVGWHKT